MQQSSYVGVNGGAPGMIYVPIPIRPRTYEALSSRQAVGLGITQIIIGSLCILFNLVIVLSDSGDGGLGFVGHGFWCGILFIISGSLGIGAGVRKTKCQITGFMVMCILSAIFTISLLTIASIGACMATDEECDYYGYNYPYYRLPCSKMDNYEVILAMEALMAALAIIEAIVAIWGSAICCKSGVCCCSAAASTTVVAPNYFPYPGQMIQISQTQGRQGIYMQQQQQQSMNTYQLGLVGPPFYSSNYVQPNWTALQPMQQQCMASPPVDPALPEYSSQYDNAPTKC